MSMKFVFSSLFSLALANVRNDPNDAQVEDEGLMPWQNWRLPIPERLDDLMSRLSISEIINQTSSMAPAIPELGILAYNWRSNCQHTWASSGGTWIANETWTVFPSPFGLGATFDTQMLYLSGDVISTEGRALHNLGVARYGASTEARGLNCYGPNINVVKDPRGGRDNEMIGEDPWMIGEMMGPFSWGIQGGMAQPTTPGFNQPYLKVGACPKHAFIQDGPEDYRETITYQVNNFNLWTTYLPAFRGVIQNANPAQIMCAYSATNLTDAGLASAAPDCANSVLLDIILRQDLGFGDNHVTSDNGAVEFIYQPHNYAPNASAAAVLAMNAGTDNDLGYDLYFTNYLPAAVNEGLVSIDRVTQAARRGLNMRFLLGEFDPSYLNPYTSYSWDQLDTPNSRALNLLAAQESFVMTKNSPLGGGSGAPVLPIAPKSVSKIVVVGPCGDDIIAQLGSYAGFPGINYTILTGISAFLSGENAAGAQFNASVSFVSGCGPSGVNTNLQLCPTTQYFNDSLTAVASADLVIFAGGLPFSLAQESVDWTSNGVCNGEAVNLGGLPGCQYLLSQAVRAATSAPIITVTIAGNPMTMPEVEAASDAVIVGGFPGNMGGLALASVIFGDYSPAGRLPYTIVSNFSMLNNLNETDLTSGYGATYKYYKAGVLHPFGYGHSFTQFTYSGLSVTPVSATPEQIRQHKYDWNTKANRHNPILGRTMETVGFPFSQVGPSLFITNDSDTISVPPCTSLTIQVSVNNTGNFAPADEVVQVYLQYPTQNLPDGTTAPAAQLVAFQRFSVGSDGINVELLVDAQHFTLVDADGFRQIIPGTYTLSIGGQQPGMSESNSCGQIPLQFQVSLTANSLVPWLSCPGATK